MRGIILAGGTGSRLEDLCCGINKHLLPIGRYPMIYYPINTMLENGIKDILIVTGNNDAGQFVNVLGDGSKFGANILYSYQSKPVGIADALRRGQQFIGDDPNFLVILGDNIFTEKLNLSTGNTSGRIFTKEVKHPEHYGVANIDENGDLVWIEEKPKKPKSNTIVTGAYLYPTYIFNRIDELSPSDRGELEISHLNNMLIAEHDLDYVELQSTWYDCGESIEEYNETSYNMRKIELNWSRS